MKRAMIAAGAFATVLVLLVLAARHRAREKDAHPAAATSLAVTSSPAATPSTAASEAHPGFLYGRVTTVDGATYEGRLRLGGDQEAFWGDYFNGYKPVNPWAAQVPPERLPKRRVSYKIFGIKIAERERPMSLQRPFMARLGDIAR